MNYFSFIHLIRTKSGLLNHMSTENFIENWKETKCYRALLANKYFR